MYIHAFIRQINYTIHTVCSLLVCYVFSETSIEMIGTINLQPIPIETMNKTFQVAYIVAKTFDKNEGKQLHGFNTC